MGLKKFVVVTAFGVLAFITIFVLMVCRVNASEVLLRDILEKSWKNHLEACRSGKESSIQQTLSSFRYGTWKNSMRELKRNLTSDLIKNMADYPEVSKMKFVDIIENGPTAGLVYARDSEERDASNKPRVIFTFIKFVKEESGWKVDDEIEMDDVKYQEDGKETQFDPSDLPAMLAIDGKVRKAPEPAPIPDFAGACDIFSYHYKTQVTINGVDQCPTQDACSSGMIKGGLRKGENSIQIIFTKTREEPIFKPTVKIRLLTDNLDTAKEVFKFEPKDNIEGEYRFTFNVDSK